MKNSNSKQKATSNVIHHWKLYIKNNVSEPINKIVGKVAKQPGENKMSCCFNRGLIGCYLFLCHEKLQLPITTQ